MPAQGGVIACPQQNQIAHATDPTIHLPKLAIPTLVLVDTFVQ
jgi:hypothetical protein